LKAILKQRPDSVKHLLRLAEFLAEADPEAAESLIKNIKIENLIENSKDLEKLENDIALSKVNFEETKMEIETKRQKKQKKRIRYPKDFDPKSPGPLPNPERWLPKHERKDFKKKKM